VVVELGVYLGVVISLLVFCVNCLDFYVEVLVGYGLGCGWLRVLCVEVRVGYF